MKIVDISALSSAKSAITGTAAITLKSSTGSSTSSTSSGNTSSDTSSQVTALEKKLSEIATEIKTVSSSNTDQETNTKKIQSLVAQEMQIMARIERLNQGSGNTSTVQPAITSAVTPSYV